MKNLLKKILFKNCYKDCALLNYGIELNNKYEKDIYKYQMKLEMIEKIKDMYSENEKIISFSNHNDKEVLVTVQSDKYSLYNNKFSLEFYAYVIDGYYLKRVQTLYADICINKNNEYSIYIVDFIGKVNQGYGSIVMKCFLDYISKMPVKQVYGYLSDIDLNHSEEHKNLLIHFYKKFGFEITDDNKIILKY